MGNKYEEHFLMNVEDAKQYCLDRLHCFGPEARLSALEIGDGNINYVFKVRDEVTGKSVIIKQADKFLRSSGRPLDLHRNRIEAEILKIEGELAPEYVPEVYDYCEAMCALSMEDISAYKNLRTEMMAGKTFDRLADGITSFLADTLLPTTDLVLDRAEKKERVKLFTNIELCDISEDLVFTEPYYNYKNRNIITEGNEGFVEKTLYQDETLKGEVGMLRDRFMNCAQALVHGDLHSGSIFANENGIKVIDPEFAFYGPMGYDVGNVIGNMFFTWANKAYTEPDNQEFLTWAENTTKEIFDLFKQKFSDKFDELVTLPLYNKQFKEQYVDSVLADTMGCAGTEIIRRVVGDTKVMELTGVKDRDTRIWMERALILTGVSFIKNRRNYKNGSEVTGTFKKVVGKQL